MNVGQALAAVLPGVPVYESAPLPVPVTPYVVVTEITDGRGSFQAYADETGHKAQERVLTLLLTLYGREGWTLAPLRPLYRALRSTVDFVTEHPELPPLRGRQRGPELPPQAADGTSKRPWCAARILLTYLE